ncbi:lipoprotein [Mesoplasma florum]|uniref:lipoprotein n=1 Tax=Mesoplasma florum TaxID=2151 RepID=UPI000BE34DC1|nr:lipoprotein [Mesoplasma florum]ATI74097.1 hypothetical protein CQZ70_02460 [Mesoplasma florum]
MKKLLSILGAVGLTATGASVAVSCSNTTDPGDKEITIANVQKAVGEVKDLADLKAVQTTLDTKLKDTKDETLKGIKSLTAALKGDSKTDVTVTVTVLEGYILDEATFDIEGAIKAEGGEQTTPITIESIKTTIGTISEKASLDEVNAELAKFAKEGANAITGVNTIVAALKGDSKTDVTVTVTVLEGYILDEATFDIEGAIKAEGGEQTTPITIESIKTTIGTISEKASLDEVNAELAKFAKEGANAITGVNTIVAALKGDSKTDVTVTVTVLEGYTLDEATFDIIGAIAEISE